MTENTNCCKTSAWLISGGSFHPPLLLCVIRSTPPQHISIEYKVLISIQFCDTQLSGFV